MPKSVFNGLGTGCPLFSRLVELLWKLGLLGWSKWGKSGSPKSGSRREVIILQTEAAANRTGGKFAERLRL